ncbi:HAD family hydrolase [Clostridium sp. NSJ-49]|uniref:HAD family hydrolase n=1 Tax=Clostridium hominis TaxID=2763036 RepID=A0ABR7DCS1_9CLOT|nr:MULTISPECIES: HAD family hydrolase [Clostridium]MBC5625274.1 HAD family hydrolase [Clostridium sp. NSJ-49]MBC5629190.1 HAD family hydrolase [Clostridium hominis]SCI89787.1 bifunctional 5'-methylthioadenosine/S-adenosylhomocysteine nucleosidase/phosphatase [uncultured Clostridium sp.]
MNKKINIIFDYDGTLHNSIKIYGPAFRKAYEYLIKEGYAEEKVWEDKEISKWLGYSAKDMWNNFMPNLQEEVKKKCSSIIGNSMIEYLSQGNAELYDGTIELLKELQERGYNLIFLSNCKIKYMNEHNKLFKLDKYFNDFYCTEQFEFKPKYEIFNFIKEKYHGDFIVIGDRFVDIEIAKVHNLQSIGCLYGFGSYEELKEATFLAKEITELKDLIYNIK